MWRYFRSQWPEVASLRTTLMILWPERVSKLPFFIYILRFSTESIGVDFVLGDEQQQESSRPFCFALDLFSFQFYDTRINLHFCYS